MSAYSLFVSRWRNGCGAQECSRAGKVVLARGTVPCQVLFLGEAPGESENILGVPFVGPAGQLLDKIVARAGIREKVTTAFCNLCGCIPREEGDRTSKATEPSDEQIEQCKPRLIEFVKIADPLLIVCVGRLAWDWTEPGYRYSINFHREIPRVKIDHPAAILRNPTVAARGMMVQRAVVVLRNTVESILQET